MSIYDEADKRLRVEHRVAIDWNGHGWWSCSCGKEQGSTSFNSTPNLSFAASRRHLDAAYRRILLGLRAERGDES